MISATVNIKLSALRKFKEQIAKGEGPVKKGLKQWAAIYRSFLQLRYDRFSKGGGNWPPLSEATIARRRKGKGKRRVSILVDTGTLKAALNPTFSGRPGSIENYTKFGVEVGYGGNDVHPGGDLTIADIASFHQHGGPNLPQRMIIVPPDKPTLERMRVVMENALKADYGK